MQYITAATKITRIYEIYNTVTTVFDALQDGFNSIIGASLTEANENLETWYDNWIAYDLRPAMQDQTAQLHTMTVDQSRNLASAETAAQQIKAQTAIAKAQTDAYVETTPNENVCEAAAVSTGMTRSRIMTKYFIRSLPKEIVDAAANETGSSSEFGNIQYQLQRFANYLSKYCNPLANNGTGCFGGTASPNPDGDILVEETLLAKDTIDISDTDTRNTVHDMVTNIVEPQAPDTMTPSAFETDDGKEIYLQRRAFRTKRKLAKRAIYDILARRSPGSNIGPLISQIRQNAGVDLTGISPNPSYNEVFNTMTERFNTGRYQLGNVTNPTAVTRESVTLQGLEVSRMNDTRQLMHVIGMIVGSQVAQEIINVGGDGSESMSDAMSGN